jgi:hypothetical protein
MQIVSSARGISVPETPEQPTMDRETAVSSAGREGNLSRDARIQATVARTVAGPELSPANLHKMLVEGHLEDGLIFEPSSCHARIWQDRTDGGIDACS